MGNPKKYLLALAIILMIKQPLIKFIIKHAHAEL